MAVATADMNKRSLLTQEVIVGMVGRVEEIQR